MKLKDAETVMFSSNSTRSQEDDSDLSESFINPKSSIRVSVCLKRYFKDVRARCYVHCVRNRRVRWLEKRIQKIFAIPGSFCLCSNGHLLPSTEPLALLRPEDSVEVFPIPDMGMLQKEVASVKNANNVSENHIETSTDPNYGVDSFRFDAKRQKQAVSIDHNKLSNAEEANTVETRIEIDDVEEPKSSRERSSESSGAANINESTRTADTRGDGDAECLSHTLQRLKRNAMALLDAQRGAPDVVDAGQPPARRVRRRVRRRTRRPPGPKLGPGPEPDPGPEPGHDSEPDPGPEPGHDSEPDPGPEPGHDSEPGPDSDSNSWRDQSIEYPPAEVAGLKAVSTPASEVTRNEVTLPRKARVVRCLEA